MRAYVLAHLCYCFTFILLQEYLEDMLLSILIEILVVFDDATYNLIFRWLLLLRCQRPLLIHKVVLMVIFLYLTSIKLITDPLGHLRSLWLFLIARNGLFGRPLFVVQLLH